MGEGDGGRRLAGGSWAAKIGRLRMQRAAAFGGGSGVQCYAGVCALCCAHGVGVGAMLICCNLRRNIGSLALVMQCCWRQQC